MTSLISTEIVTVDVRPSEAFKALIWEVFFASRHRGISLDVHFPWMNLPVDGIHYVELRSANRLAGGLVFKLQNHQDQLFGLVGLVCVAETFRGQGLSRRLLREAEELASRQRCSSLTLWTGKPGVYKGLGYVHDGHEVFGGVRQGVAAPQYRPSRNVAPPLFLNVLKGDARGLPAFAQSIETWADQRNGASVVVLDDGAGPIVAEWSGSASQVALLLARSMPATWRLNAMSNDDLLEKLYQAGYELNLRPAGLRMTRPLVNARSDASLTPPDFRLLDRF